MQQECDRDGCEMRVLSFHLEPSKWVGSCLHTILVVKACYRGSEHVVRIHAAEFQTKSKRLVPSRKTCRRIADRFCSSLSASKETASKATKRVADFIGVIPIPQVRGKKRTLETITCITDSCRALIGKRIITLDKEGVS